METLDGSAMADMLVVSTGTPMESIKHIQWSFSSLKSYSNCPQRYFHERVLRDVVGTTHPSATYGKNVHESIEAFLTDGTPFPEEHKQYEKYITPYTEIPGQLMAEYDCSMRADFTPCKATDQDVWYKGFIDIAIIDHENRRAFVSDAKTGSPRWADPDQLEIYALALFYHFPQIDEVRGMLDFLLQDTQVKRKYSRLDSPLRWISWHRKLAQVVTSQATGIWPAKKTPLCKFCPVSTCHHHPECP